MPPCRSRHRSGRPLERGSRCFHHQPRTSQNTRHTGTIAPRRHYLPHLQMDSFPHTRGTFSIYSQPPLRGPSPPSQSRWRAPTPQRPPRTTPPRPNRPQPPPPSSSLMCSWTLPLDFAHLETGQYKNSPNAWKLPSKTVLRDLIAEKRREEKKIKKLTAPMNSCNVHGSSVKLFGRKGASGVPVKHQSKLIQWRVLVQWLASVRRHTFQFFPACRVCQIFPE